MEITLEQYEKIQQFLDGSMDAGKAADFLREMQTDKELQESFDVEKLIRDSSVSIQEARAILLTSSEQEEFLTDDTLSRKSGDNAGLRTLIAQAGDEWNASRPATTFSKTEGPIPSDKSVISLRGKLTLAAAAVVLVAIAGITFFHFYSRKSPDPAALFAQFFKKDSLPKGDYPMLAQALTDYKNNNYLTLQRYDLENLPTMKGGDDQHQQTLELGYYYRGLSYLSTNQPAKATRDLQWVIDRSMTEELKWKAQWYQALAALQSSNVPAAIGPLQAVSTNPKAQGYNLQATSLLQQLKAFGH